MERRQSRNGWLKKIAGAIITGIIGWFGYTVWSSAVDIAVMKTNQEFFRGEIAEMKSDISEVKTAVLRVERAVKR
jgi:hypothetical protein